MLQTQSSRALYSELNKTSLVDNSEDQRVVQEGGKALQPGSPVILVKHMGNAQKIDK